MKNCKRHTTFDNRHKPHCDCEQNHCESHNIHIAGDCPNTRTVKTIGGTICFDCAQTMPKNYLLLPGPEHRTYAKTDFGQCTIELLRDGFIIQAVWLDQAQEFINIVGHFQSTR